MGNWPKKSDTSKGFQPRFALGPDLFSPARDALRMDGALDRSVLSPTLHRFLQDWARLRNAHSSAKLEGNPIDMDDARRVLEEGKATKPSEEEILRLSRAYKRIHDTKKFSDLTVEEIRDLHRELFVGVLTDEDLPGSFKDKPNGVKEGPSVVFEATPPERTEAELESLLAWYYGTAQAFDPAIAAGMFFVEFQSIHPFLDGNGRIGRILNQRLLRAAGYRNVTLTALDGQIFRRSGKYYESLRATNRGSNYETWLRFYTDTLRRAYKEALARGDLAPVLDAVSPGAERDVLEWALATGTEWFQRGDFPNKPEYAGVTLSGALASLVRRGAFERKGDKRGARYRLSEDFLRGIYDRNARLEESST